MCCTAGGREGHAASGNVHISLQIVSAVHGEGRTGDAVKPEPSTLPLSGARGYCSPASTDSGGWGLQLASWRPSHTHPGRSHSRKAGETGLLILLVFLLIYPVPGGEAGVFLLPVPSVLRVVHYL